MTCPLGKGEAQLSLDCNMQYAKIPLTCISCSSTSTQKSYAKKDPVSGEQM